MLLGTWQVIHSIPTHGKGALYEPMVHVLNGPNRRGYALTLANGHGWLILPVDGRAKAIAGELASVMQLREVRWDVLPVLLLVGENGRSSGLYKGDGPPLLPSAMAEEGWTFHDMNLIKCWLHPRMQDMVVLLGEGDERALNIMRMWFLLNLVFMKAQVLGSIPLHGALVEREGRAVVLAGPSGRGKTTCCRRLSPRWRALCDDQILAIPRENGTFRAHPFPTWSRRLLGGSVETWDVQRDFSLNGIFFIEQSKINEVQRVPQAEAAIFLQQSAEQVIHPVLRYLPPNQKRAVRVRILDNASLFARSVPAFLLRTRERGEIHPLLERALDGKDMRERAL